MSKLFEKIQEAVLGEYRASISKMITVDQQTTDGEIPTERLVEISATFGRRVYCPKGDEIHAKKNIIEALRHELYGDLYGLLANLHVAVAEGNMTAIRNVTCAIRREIMG